MPLKCSFQQTVVDSNDLSAHLWWIWSFCVQMWMSVPRVTCVWVGYVPTRRDPTPAPSVRLATESLKTGRGVKVKIISAIKNASGQLVSSPSKLLCCATKFPPYGIQSYIDVQKCPSWCVFHSDIDECQSLSTCANGICLNSEGSYTCENCPTGYRVSYNGELCEGWFIQHYSSNWISA